MQEPAWTLGQNLWDIRHAIPLSVRELARISGVDELEIHAFEDDHHTPSRDVLKILLEVMNSVNRLEELCVLGDVSETQG